MDCDVEVEEEINPFLPKLPLVRAFCHGNELWLVLVYAGCFQGSNLLEEYKTGIFYFKYGFV